MKTFQTSKKDKTDTTQSVSGEFKNIDMIAVIHRSLPNSFAHYVIKSLNKTIVLRGKRDLKVPYNIEKEIKDSENILANRGPQPSPSSTGEAD